MKKVEWVLLLLAVFVACMLMLPGRVYGGGGEIRKKIKRARAQVQEPAAGWIIKGPDQAIEGPTEWDVDRETLSDPVKPPVSRGESRMNDPAIEELEFLRKELDAVVKENERNMAEILEIVSKQSERQNESESTFLKIIEGVAGLVAAIGGVMGIYKGRQFVKKRTGGPNKLW